MVLAAGHGLCETFPEPRQETFGRIVGEVIVLS